MSASNGSQPAGRADSQQAREALRQTLSALGGGGSLTPEGLAELVERAGLANPGRVAGLMGLDSGARAVPQHIFFALGEDECALPAGTVQGVERMADVTRVPNTAGWVLGVVQVSGHDRLGRGSASARRLASAATDQPQPVAGCLATRNDHRLCRRCRDRDASPG